MEISQHLQATLDNAPTKPGCYLMKDAEGQVIYVGKAINLRNRLRSYFHESAQEDRKTRKLVRNIVDIEWIVVGSELEALILEMNLIKKHRPHFNVRLKDDKRYPYIKVHWNKPLPQADRNPPDGARRFTVLRTLHQRMGGAPNPGCAAQDLPLPDLRPRDHRQGCARLPVLRYQAVRGTLHWRNQPGKLSPDDR